MDTWFIDALITDVYDTHSSKWQTELMRIPLLLRHSECEDDIGLWSDQYGYNLISFKWGLLYFKHDLMQFMYSSAHWMLALIPFGYPGI